MRSRQATGEGSRLWHARRRACAGRAADEHPESRSDHEETRSPAPRRIDLEPGEPLHWLDRCRPDGEGLGRSRSSGPVAEAGRLRVRRGVHVCASAGHQDTLDGARRDGLHVDPDPPYVTPERAPLRRAAGPHQGGDGGPLRRRAGQELASRLRCGPPALGGWRPAPRKGRPTLRRPGRGGISKDRMPEGHGGARVMPYWHATIAPAVRTGQRVMIAAHGNSLRALVKSLDSISDSDIVELNIPTGTTLVYELDDQLRPIRY